MPRYLTVLIAVAVLAACGPLVAPDPDAPPQSLSEARAAHHTVVPTQERDGTPVPIPPADIFRKVTYTSPVGDLAAYVSPPPTDGAKRPAIIWITGGDSNTIGELWGPQDPRNDQTAAAYREAGLVLMLPSLRGGNQNPGYREGFYGELDDILAARDYLASLPYVDAHRIYLGGHSTGGTMVLLAAEYSDKFRAVFAFGPVATVDQYGGDYLPAGLTDAQEIRLRSPDYWLESVKTPTFVIEGIGGNAQPLEQLRVHTDNDAIKFLLVMGAGHFDTLSPINTLIARKILADTGPVTNITLSEDELRRTVQGR